MKEVIIEALGDMENKRALRKLIEIIKSDAPPRLKKRAIEALGESLFEEASLEAGLGAQASCLQTLERRFVS